MLPVLPDLSLLAPILDAAIAVDEAIGGNVQRYDARRGTLTIIAQRGFREPFLKYFEVVRADDGSACAQALADRRRIIIRDTATDPAFAPHRRVAEEAGFRSVISTPLLGTGGRIVGVLSTHFKHPHVLGCAALARIDTLAQLAAQVIETSDLVVRIERPSARRRSTDHELSPVGERAAAAARQKVGSLSRPGVNEQLVEGAILEFGRLIPELRRLERDR